MFIFFIGNPMNNTWPQRKFTAQQGTLPTSVPHTFEDWQTEQLLDARSPEERGIHIGSAVMWRHRQGNVIMTDRATVTAVMDNELTLLVKDVQAHTCHAHVHEIVDYHIRRFTLDKSKQPSVLADQVEAPATNGHAFPMAIPADW